MSGCKREVQSLKQGPCNLDSAFPSSLICSHFYSIFQVCLIFYSFLFTKFCCQFIMFFILSITLQCSPSLSKNDAYHDSFFFRTQLRCHPHQEDFLISHQATCLSSMLTQSPEHSSAVDDATVVTCLSYLLLNGSGVRNQPSI